MNSIDDEENYKLYYMLQAMARCPRYGLVFYSANPDDNYYMDELVDIGLAKGSNGAYFSTFRGLWVLHMLNSKGYKRRDDHRLNWIRMDYEI